MRTLNAPHPPAATLLQDACVAMLFDDGSCLLDSGVRARRALSCLVEPRAGDRVLVGARADGAHVLHIVEREPCGAVCLSAPGAQALTLRQARVGVYAAEALDLASAGDASLTAAGGSLALSGRNLLLTARESIVELADHYVGRIGQYLLEVRELLRLHGHDALVTATRDVKVDAERISMG